MFEMKQDTIEVYAVPNITLSVNLCNFCIILYTNMLPQELGCYQSFALSNFQVVLFYFEVR